MSSKNVVELTDSNFEDEVKKSDIPVLVDLWAEWCMPCKMLAPIIDVLADEFEGKIKVCKLDIESNYKTASAIGVSAIPTILLYKNGEIAKKLVGGQNKMSIKAAIEEL